MSFLPLVQRELRAASRRKSTFRVRWWTVVFAMAMTFVSLFFLWVTQTARGGAGSALFGIVTGYAFGLCLLAGVFLTADCLSEERREGTLPLLFLADLRAHDVVLGKFFARSLNAFYGLVAILPITAIPLLLGGVTGGEFWRSALALLNTLFLSLAAGIWVSAIARDAQQAIGGTFGLLALIIVGSTALQWLGNRLPLFHPFAWTLWLSPLEAFNSASDTAYFFRTRHFWGSLLASNLLAWTLLASGAWILSRLWHEDKIFGSAGEIWTSIFRNCQLKPAGRKKRKPELLEKNPVMWLAGEEPVLRKLLWLIVIGWGVAVFAIGMTSPKQPMNAYTSAKICGFLFKALIASQACRFFAESRRNGALELLLCTPLRNRDLVNGQFATLRRLFLWPIVTFLLLGFVPVIFLIASMNSASEISHVMDTIFGLGGGLATILWFSFFFLMDILAVCWFGMWLALSIKQPTWAAPLTILLVLVLPAPFCVLDIVADLIFIIWGASQLQQDFRWVLARQYSSRARRAAPQSLFATPSPPIIQ